LTRRLPARRLALLELFHPGPSLATTLAALAMAFALRVPLSYWPAVLRLVAAPMLLAQLAISVLNDWADRAADARAGRGRALEVGLLWPGAALALACGLALAGLAWSWWVGDGPAATALLALGIAAGFAYDLWLKATPWSFLPFAFAFPLLVLWVSAVVGYGPPAWVTFLGGAPLAVAVHLADSVPDLDADRRSGLRTLAVALGGQAATRAAATLLAAGCAVLALDSLRADPWLAAFILLIGIAAGAAFISGWTSRWIAAAAAVIVTVAWLWVAPW
jgi:4-hydroxybenzoate polyprenyltransferase